MSEKVSVWLNGLGLGQYADAFEKNAIVWSLISKLNHELLKEMGINSVGHRMQILEAADELDSEQPPAKTGVELPFTTGEAERRQLTVMFCDLEGSTELSQQLDPEDLREINRAYQDTCKAAIERYEGYVARYMGDGVLAYFGYPQAHEDDAERAIHAGLSVVDLVRALKTERYGVVLGVRVGIATGSVVVGDLIGEGASQESAVVGETPNIAAKLQGLAKTNTVVVGTVTHELTNTKFSYKDGGACSLKGISEPLRSWRVIKPINVESRFDANRKSGLTPLVGREQEIGLLLERWQQAKEGDEQVVLLCGEAGIGKSRIAETILQQAAEDQAVELLYQCSPYYSNTALHPVITRLERMAKFELDDSNEVKLEKLEALLARETTDASSLAPLYAALLSVHVQGHYQPLEMTAERQKHRTLEALVGHIKDLTRRNPVMCLFEDIHWADPTTLELLGRMIESVQNVPILVVLTYRPEFSPPWRGFTHVTSLTLNRFTRRLASALVESVSDGAQLPDEVRQQIIEKTDGVPIFIEELTKNILESTLTSGGSPTVAIPTTLHDSLMARLDRLGAVKEVAQSASVLGREFDRNLLALVSPLGPEKLDAALDQLLGAELIYRRGQPEEGRYIFKHALVQDAAYGSLLKAKRQTLHGNIARALKDRFPERTDAEPEMLAHHYTEAGMQQEAIPLWSDAGTRAASRHAVLEAINHFRRALQLLSETPPDHLRDEREMKLQIALGSVMQSLGAGIPEVAAAYNRAHELSQRIANIPDLFSILQGLWHFSVFRAEIVQSAELVAQMRRLAGAGENTEQQVVTYYASSFLALMSADLETAREEQETGLALFNGLPRDLQPFRAGQNPGVAFQVYAGLALWLQGYPDQAAARCRQGISLAREINHPFSLAFSFDISLVVFHSLREIKVVKELSDEDIELSERHGFGQWLHAARIWKGWVESMTDPSGSGLEQMIEANEMVRSKDGEIFQGNSQGAIAGAYLQAGQFESALSAANEALAHVERTGECWWEAESHRLKGQALRGLGEESSVFGDCFSRALEVARSQQSRSLELRAAVDLAQVWIDRDKRDDARKLLATVYDWFTEGFDTTDLRQAKALLEELT